MAADNYTNGVGVAAIRDWADGKFALDSDLDTLAEEVAEIIAEGGEPNVIESIDVNGTDVPPVQKNVSITVPTQTSDLTNDGDGTDSSSPFATQAYVAANGGKIDTIKVNGTAQTITNKAVDITVPTKVSDLTNDSGFQTSSDVSTAITTALANGSDPYQTESDVDAAIESAVVGALKPKGSTTFANLPALSAANLNSMYNVSDAFTTTADFVEGAGVSYPAGTNVAIVNTGTDQNPVYKYDAMPGVVDLSAYWTSTSGQNNSLTAFTYAEVTAILNQSS